MKLLLWNLRTLKVKSLSPIHSGMYPENLLLPKSKTLKDLKFPESCGSSLWNLLSFNFNHSNDEDIFIKETGKTPDNPFKHYQLL